jgi:multidrug resistance efflux pump
VAFVTAGDHVKKGQVLLELETDQLQLQLDGVLADTSSARAAIDDALARRDSRDLAAARADLAESTTRKSNLEKRLENAVLRAPVDGVVLRGDVDRRVGETVPEGEPLMEIAGNDGRLILLRIRECDALQLKADQRGVFALEAQPFGRTLCRVRRILPATEVHEGVNYVIAEADIGAHPEWVKVGMKGTASIDVGRRKVSWILFHDIWDWVRGRLWL